MFRVAQEAIANACTHSQSKWVRVTLVQEEDAVTLEVQDRGKGFDVFQVAEDRFGLDGIRERTRLLGSELQIDSKPGQGTTIRDVSAAPAQRLSRRTRFVPVQGTGRPLPCRFDRL